MNIFKKLFLKKKKTTSLSTSEVAEGETVELTEAQLQQFEMEFNTACQQAVPRYLALPAAQIDLELKNETGQSCGFAEAFPARFKEWRKLKSVWDQRTIIYSLLDELLGRKLDPWQRILRLVDDRFAEKALAEVEKADDLVRSKADFWAAAAKTYQVLTEYEEAERCAQRCLSLQPAHPLGEIVLADVFFVTDRAAGAQQHYQKILQNSEFAQAERGQKIAFQDVIAFEHNVLHSPMYAAAWLHENPYATIETWDRTASEFYWSPHFRTQHAYYLLQHNEPLQGLAKLLTITKEMPWFKEAVLNAHRLLLQMQAEKALADEMSRISKLILDRGWQNEIQQS